MHLNSIDHHGTRWQTYNELWSAGKGCESGFPRLNKHRHGEHEVKQSTSCQPRQWSEKRGSERKKRRKQRETGVYKQTPCYKFVFSRCQVLWPSLRLSVRSILFGLACARAVAINFTECYEPLIRLANGACNLAASEPKALWITDTRGEINCNSFSMGPFELTVFFCISVFIIIRFCNLKNAHVYMMLQFCMYQCVSWPFCVIQAAGNFSPKSENWIWHPSLFCFCLKLNATKIISFMISKWLKMFKNLALEQTWGAVIDLSTRYFIKVFNKFHELYI